MVAHGEKIGLGIGHAKILTTQRYAHLAPGSRFRTEKMLRFGYFPSPPQPPSPEESRRCYQRIVERLRGLSGVAPTNQLPLLSSHMGSGYRVRAAPGSGDR